MSLDFWSILAAAFIAGFGAGAGFAFYRSKTKLGLYRQFIEDRLSRWTDQRRPMTLLPAPGSTVAIDTGLGPDCAAAGDPEALLIWPGSMACSQSLLKN